MWCVHAGFTCRFGVQVRWYVAQAGEHAGAMDPTALDAEALRTAFAVPSVADATAAMASFHSTVRVRSAASFANTYRHA